MKLKSLKAAGFRAFNEEQSVDLDGKLVIYTGPNGGGKSSIGEAVEWVLFGCTLRRVKGDEISKREFAGCYRNVHYKGTAASFVEAIFIDSTGKDIVIKRELQDDETSKLFLDGKQVFDLKILGIRDVYDRPLILQHTLHDFIYMKPKSRYEILSAMLGLDELITFRSGAEDIKNNLPKNYTKPILDIVYKAKPLITKLESFPITKPIAEMLTRNETDAAYDQLLAIAMGRIPPGVDPKDVLDSLKSEKASKERHQLDWGKFSFQGLVLDSKHPIEKNVADLEKASPQKVFSELFIKIGESKKGLDEQKSREFFLLGLELISDEGLCPFCLTKALTQKRLEEIKRICSESEELRKELDQVRNKISVFKRSLPTAWNTLFALFPKLPDEKETSKILDLLKEKDISKIPFLVEARELSKLTNQAEVLKTALDLELEACYKYLDPLTKDSKATDFGEALKKYFEALRNIANPLNSYASAYSKLDPKIKAELASASDVAFVDLLIETIGKWVDIKALKYLDNIQNELLDLVRAAREHIEEKQKDILGKRDKQIKEWYDLMNQGAGVGYDSILPRTDALDLQARTFNKLMMASPNLSTAQLNCIGLAIALACATRINSPYKFVMIDDPIQSMDDDHAEAFKKSVVKKLLETGFQVILLTQMPKFGNQVEALYRTAHDAVHLYNMKEYQVVGPIIEYGGPEIKQLIEEVRANKDSTNDAYRKNATQSLRQFVERFVKDLYVCESGKSISKKYEDAQWARLTPLLKQCKGFNASDEAILKDTHDFTSPFLHSDDSVGRKVPGAHQLNPHYDNMKSILQKYKGTLGITV